MLFNNTPLDLPLPEIFSDCISSLGFNTKRIGRFLHSYFVPSTTEHQAIREHLGTIEAEKTRVRKEREVLQAALDKLDAELAVLEGLHSKLSGAVSCLRYFPAEILQNIFHLAIPELTWLDQPRWRSPWTISQVCSRWRHIALSTPSLWTRVHPPPCHLRESQVTMGVKKILELSIERSQELPIHFILGEDYDDVCDNTPRVECYACQILTKLSPRIRHLICWYSHDEDMKTENPPQFLRLQTFCGHVPSPSPLLHCVPLLKAVDLETNFLYTSELQLPWAQLTHLSLTATNEIGQLELSQTLRECTGLVFFGLEIGCDVSQPMEDSEEMPVIREPVNLPHLRVMHAIGITGARLDRNIILLDIFKNLRCPILESFTIEGYNDTYRQLVIDSCCQATLTDLFIGTSSYQLDKERDSFLRLLEQLENIEVLTLYTRSDMPRWKCNRKFVDQICAALKQPKKAAVSRAMDLRIVSAGVGNRPLTYLENSPSLWRNSFAYFLHSKWDDSLALLEDEYDEHLRQGRAASPGIPHRTLKEQTVCFSEFDGEFCSSGIVGQSGIRYLCFSA